MRDFHFPGRSTVHAINGMAATSHPLATLSAIEALREGGNAIDAAVTASAVLCAVEAKSTGIGGDCFVLYAPGGRGPLIGLNGSGRAPAGANAEWFRERGIERIEPRSVHAVTVPGAIDAWERILADHGTFGLDRCLQPAIRYCEEGAPVSPRTAWDWVGLVDALKADPTAKRIFLPRGRAPRVGEIHRQPELGKVLGTIARKGAAGFYRGAVARDIVGYLRRLGGLHTLDDFANHASDYVTPIRTRYRGHSVCEIPPNGQGITALIMLNILSGFDLAGLDPNSAERLHLEVEAGRLAYSARDAYVADPAAAPVPTARLLSKRYADSERARIRRRRAITDLRPPAALPLVDTVYLTVVDRDQNAVSFINSTFWSFGSGLVSPKTGVVLQNRGAGFTLEPGHPNCIEPGKRPLHTIIPGMLMKGPRAVMPFGVMGGYYQPAGHAHLVSNVLDFGMDLQEAIDAPRALHVNGALNLERGIDDECARCLRGFGHTVVRTEVPFGGAQAIWIDWKGGTLIGASEPRKDGCALGY